jgi:hypothetical protein
LNATLSRAAVENGRINDDRASTPQQLRAVLVRPFLMIVFIEPGSINVIALNLTGQLFRLPLPSRAQKSSKALNLNSSSPVETNSKKKLDDQV